MNDTTIHECLIEDCIHGTGELCNLKEITINEDGKCDQQECDMTNRKKCGTVKMKHCRE